MCGYGRSVGVPCLRRPLGQGPWASEGCWLARAGGWQTLRAAAGIPSRNSPETKQTNGFISLGRHIAVHTPPSGSEKMNHTPDFLDVHDLQTQEK